MQEQHFVELPKEQAKRIGRKIFYGKKCHKHGFVPKYISDNSCAFCRNKIEEVDSKEDKLLKNEEEFLQSDDGEVWKPINIDEYREDYKVSNNGRVWSNLRKVLSGRGGYRYVGGYLMTPTDDGDGYPAVGLTYDGQQKTMRVHRLVMLTFNEYPQNPELVINHKDGNKWNNVPDNLEWVTTQENTAHSVATGLWDRRNEKAANSKLTWEDVDYIRKNYKYRCPVNNAVRIAERLGVESTSVYNVLDNHTWNEEYRDV